jgi:hypothetical protein
MNIFYLHHDPKTCAQMHNDKHVVKMILEYAQLLSTAHRVIDGVESVGLSKSGRKQKRYVLPDNRDSVLYSATHLNHPSAVWVRKRESHYRWLFTLWHELMDEYTHRYGKVHATARLMSELNKPPTNIEFGGGFDEPTPAMPDDYKVKNDVITSYRNYYLNDKVKMSRWTNTPMPDWFASGINTLYGDTCYIERDVKKDRIISMPFYESKHANIQLSQY